MSYLEPVRFGGTLSDSTTSVSVEFTADINDDGQLRVRLEPLLDRCASALNEQRRPGEPAQTLELQGRSEEGWFFHSDHFVIGTFRFSDKELEIQGQCSLAKLSRKMEKPVNQTRRLWFVRKLRTRHAMDWSGSIGCARVAGPHDTPANSQQPSGGIQLTHPTGLADAQWLEESEQFLIHVARVMSFGCDCYLTPIMEKLWHGDQVTWRVIQRGRTTTPFMAPFHFIHLEPIFRRACDSYATHRDEVAQLDPAIRWLTVPVALWEQRLINGMTALESILDRTAPDGTRLFLPNSTFKKVAKAVRDLLKEKAAPEGMLVKLPDLNRRAFKEQFLALLDHRKILSNDLREGWLDDVVRSRNHLVHTGVAPETEEQSGVSVSQIVQVREVVTRLILERIGFVGAYQSWLHNDRALHFPDCERMDLWVTRNAADPIPLSDV